MTEVQTNPLSEDFHTFSLIRFAFPSMAMMLFMGVYTITDTIFAARFIDTNALSAINIVCPVLNLIVGMGTMLAAGGRAVVAREMGSKRAGEARSNFTLIILTGALLGLAVSLIGFVFLEEIIRGLGASELLLPYCRDYLRIQLFFAAGNIMQVLYQNLFVTAGKPGLGLVLSVFAGIANIVFDYIFIVLLQMGIRGASLGTSIGYMIPTLAGTVFFFTGKSELHFCRPKMDLAVLGKSCSNGASEMVSQLSSAVTTFLFNGAMMRLMKEDGVAAITVIIYSQFLLTTLFIGFSMGTAPVISYNYGSQNEKRLKKVVRICFCFIGAVSLLVFLFSLFAGRHIAGIFSGTNTHVYELAKDGFAIFSFSFLFSGCNIFASALFTALSNGKVSAAISFFRTFGLITVFLLVLPRFLGVAGVWAAIPAAEMGTFVLTGCMVCRYRKH